MKLILWITLAGISIGCTSCSKTEPASPNGNTPLSSTSSTQTMMSDLLLVHRRVNSVNGSTSIPFAQAVLWNVDSNRTVYAGVLTIDGDTVGYRHGNSSTIYQPIDSFPFALNGSYYTFSLSGASGFPALIDSVKAPQSATIITYPAAGDSITQSAGLVLTWSGSGADGVFVTVIDTSRTVGSKFFRERLLSDNGSLTIDSADLAPLKKGPIEVRVIRGNVKQGETSGRPYQLSISSEHTVIAYLQ